MANVKISALPELTTTPANTDVVPIVDGGITKKVSRQNLVGGLQETLVSGTNIKTVNSTSLLGSGDVSVQDTLVSGTNIKTVNSTSLLGSGNVAVQDTLVSGTNIKTVNSTSLLGSGNVAVQDTLVSGTNIKTINGNSVLGSGDLSVSTSPAGADTNVQYNSGGSFAGSSEFNFDGTNVAIGGAIGGAGSKKLTVTSLDQCVALFDNNVTGSGIAFTDATTLDADQVGVGAFGDILCLRGGGNAAGTAQLGNDYLTLRGGELRNFIPAINTISATTTIDSANEDSYNAQVVEVTGAVTITIDSSVRDGFNISFIQMDANQATFAASGATLQNRQAHTQTAGQWATTTIYKNGSNVILAGDTA